MSFWPDGVRPGMAAVRPAGLAFPGCPPLTIRGPQRPGLVRTLWHANGTSAGLATATSQLIATGSRLLHDLKSLGSRSCTQVPIVGTEIGKCWIDNPHFKRRGQLDGVISAQAVGPGQPSRSGQKGRCNTNDIESLGIAYCA